MTRTQLGPRKPFVAGNWKLNLTIADGRSLAENLAKQVGQETEVEIAVAPVFTVLGTVSEALSPSNIRLSSQDVSPHQIGAFTGEVSAAHLIDAGCEYAIVGHSERRQLFGEDDATVRAKAVAALNSGLAPIICVGESLQIREAGEAETHVLRQAEAALAGLTASQLARVVVAYEPIWAIGTGKTAAPSDAQQMHMALRGKIAALHGDMVANGMRILYGGSVKPDNARNLIDQPDVDGALVGGASLVVDSFTAIINAVRCATVEAAR